jgi:cell division protease FtsH
MRNLPSGDDGGTIMTDIKHTAYHEAGHAVMALRLGYEVGKVTIVRRQGVLGKAHIRNRTSPDDIRIDLAGQLAEALVNPSEEKIQLGALCDWRNTRRSVREFVALGFIGDQEGGILIEELLHETRALVRRDREAISRVAEALLERKTLTGPEIKRIMEAVS